MKKLATIAFLVFATVTTTLAQGNKDELEILKIHSSLDQAFLKKDAAVFERVLADDYVYSTPTGKVLSRAESLEDLRKEWANTKYKILTSATDGARVRVSGNMALVTANWTTTGAPTDANAEPHKDTGRYTGVYEKRNGQWLLIAEHFSEAPHDRKLMEQQVLKIAQESAQMYKNKDGAAMDRIMADEFIHIDGEGKVKNRTEVLAGLKTDDEKLESVELSDQKVHIIGNAAAVETGTIRFRGSWQGKAFEETERYTTTWVWRDGRWQIVADHTSVIKQ